MKILSQSVKDTLRLGRIVAGNLEPGGIVCLFGELGSGKTVFTKGIALGLGLKKEEVISPSFVLIRQHLKGKIPLYHFDLYRLNQPQEILSLGYHEYLYGRGITVIEWADRLKYLLPREFLKVELSAPSATHRELKFSCQGRRCQRLLKKIYENFRP